MVKSSLIITCNVYLFLYMYKYNILLKDSECVVYEGYSHLIIISRY